MFDVSDFFWLLIYNQITDWNGISRAHTVPPSSPLIPKTVTVNPVRVTIFTTDFGNLGLILRIPPSCFTVIRSTTHIQNIKRKSRVTMRETVNTTSGFAAAMLNFGTTCGKSLKPSYNKNT